MDKTDPSTVSSAYVAMRDAWTRIDDILSGPEAIRAKRELYLPKYEAEDAAEYERRVKAAPWRAEFADALRNIASKPFGETVKLDDKSPDVIAGKMDSATKRRTGGLVDDIDARGNNLTAFSREFFEGAVGKGMQAILVDYPTMSPGATLADEQRAGARPYWVQIRAEDIIALYTAVVGGRETIVHIRIKECAVERDGYGETTIERIREFDRERVDERDAEGRIIKTTWLAPVWRVWELKTSADGKSSSWEVTGSGEINRRGKTDIPIAILWTGQRKGDQFVKPPLADLADMQIELYRALSREDEILTYAGSPMLAANGFAPPQDGSTVQTGPKRVLFAPAGDQVQTSWAYVQPDAANLKEVREKVQSVIDDMRRLGMQPLTPKSGDVTATLTSVEAAKAHSAAEAWALALQDVLDQAFVYTSEWLGISDTIRTTVDTDFAVQPYAQAPLDALDKARARKDLSQRTYWTSLKRFDVLPPDFDAKEEEKAIAEEMQGLEPEQPIDPVTGKPIDPNQPPLEPA